jgi:hypothetical protein
MLPGHFATRKRQDTMHASGSRAPKNQIDYIMVSACTGGLIDEAAEPSAQVRVDLLPGDFNLFREHQSDHIPVTLHIKVVPDND